MPLHFDAEEFAGRQARALTALNEAGLDAILLFAPHSHYWLTGYDTFGYAFFQCMILDANGRIDLLTRAPDLRQAQFTSVLPSDRIHIWRDVEGMDPAADLQDLVERLGLAGKRLGIEVDTHGLTAQAWLGVRAALGDGLVPSDGLMRALRRAKTPAEIAMHRRAAELADDALDAALEETRAKAFEGDILAAQQGAVFRGGGDYAGNEFILGSGPGALMCRYYSGRRHLEEQDQLTLEWAGSFARYQAAMMRTIVIGKPDAEQVRMHAACVEALEACEAQMRPGKPMGNVFAAHARVFDAHGYGHARLNACGYGMGIGYNPVWSEPPMFYENNPLEMQPGNTFFLHMILMDSNTGLAMCWGHSVLITETGATRLSRHSLDMITG